MIPVCWNAVPFQRKLRWSAGHRKLLCGSARARAHMHTHANKQTHSDAGASAHPHVRPRPLTIFTPQLAELCDRPSTKRLWRSSTSRAATPGPTLCPTQTRTGASHYKQSLCFTIIVHKSGKHECSWLVSAWLCLGPALPFAVYFLGFKILLPFFQQRRPSRVRDRIFASSILAGLSTGWSMVTSCPTLWSYSGSFCRFWLCPFVIVRALGRRDL